MTTPATHRFRPNFNFRNAVSSSLGQITLSGFSIGQRSSMQGPRILGQYALVLIIDGEGEYRDENGWEQDLAAGDLVMVFPTLRHYYGPRRDSDWLSSYLCFAGPIFDLWHTHAILDPRRPVKRLSPVRIWNQRFESVLGAGRHTGFAPPLLEICRLQDFLGHALAGGGGAAEHQQDMVWAERACALIDAFGSATPDWEAIARELGESVGSFRKRFARVVGHPPGQYRMGRIIDRACQMMHEGRHTVREIALLLGFCDEFYFSRRFKQITGYSPRAFRQIVLPMLGN